MPAKIRTVLVGLIITAAIHLVADFLSAVSRSEAELGSGGASSKFVLENKNVRVR